MIMQNTRQKKGKSICILPLIKPAHHHHHHPSTKNHTQTDFSKANPENMKMTKEQNSASNLIKNDFGLKKI